MYLGSSAAAAAASLFASVKPGEECYFMAGSQSCFGNQRYYLSLHIYLIIIFLKTVGLLLNREWPSWKTWKRMLTCCKNILYSSAWQHFCDVLKAAENAVLLIAFVCVHLHTHKDWPVLMISWKNTNVFKCNSRHFIYKLGETSGATPGPGLFDLASAMYSWTVIFLAS